MARAPLRGIKVLDLTKVLAEPLCTQSLADLGADIIKVEPLGTGDETRHWPPQRGGAGAVFLSVNRNKRSLALDLKSAEGLAVFKRLAAGCDVLVESFGTGVVERLGVTLPDLGLPRIMAAGRRTTWHGDIAIGAAVRRDSRIANVAEKQGRSGRFAIVTLEHRISADALAVVEEQDYVMREPDLGTPAAARPRPASAERILVPDETMLLRYCAITYNAHRIHYDLPYATGVEGYPALVVNGGIPILALLELYRSQARREPGHAVLRNLAPLFCGRAMRLCADLSDQGWQLWAEDDDGRVAVEMTVT